jgi:hypothetical protein
MSQISELKARIHAKRKQLEADLAKLQAEGHAASNTAQAEIKRKLAELDDHLRDGWDNLSEKAAAKLNQWLK